MDKTSSKQFTGGSDGGAPYGSLVLDSAGEIYGTTSRGGAYSSGIAYKLEQDRRPNCAALFCWRTDGADPVAGLIRDAAGNLYGTTFLGGLHGQGTVFRVTASSKETVLYSFTGTGGSEPWAALLRDSAGNLYGTTYQGGDTSCLGGCGVVFALKP